MTFSIVALPIRKTRRKFVRRIFLVSILTVVISLFLKTSGVQSNAPNATVKKQLTVDVSDTLVGMKSLNGRLDKSADYEALGCHGAAGEVQLAMQQATPLSLASADFDEDGVPDLVGGFDFNGRGFVSQWRGIGREHA